MWNPQTDYNLQNAWNRQYHKSWSRPQNERRSRIFHTITWKIFDNNIKPYMHLKDESIFYLCSKFHPDRCKFSVIIRLSKFTPDFWSRLPTFTLGFYNHLTALMNSSTLGCVTTMKGKEFQCTLGCVCGGGGEQGWRISILVCGC